MDKPKKIKSRADLKAYQFRSKDGEHCGIIFAYSNVEARRFAASDADCDFEDIESVNRRPDFDQYKYIGKVPPSVLISEGWWISCAYTGNNVDSDNDFYIDDKDNVYESIEAYKQSLKDRARVQLMRLSIVKKVIEKFPFAMEIRWNEGFGNDDQEIRRPVVYFKFSNKAKQTAEWLVGTSIVSVSKQDLEIWHSVNKDVEKDK